MKINHLKICIVCSLFFVLSCNNDDCFTAIGINGEWIWEKSSGGFFGVTTTPETENVTRKLIIDDFTVKEFVNDDLVYESQYDLEITTDSTFGGGEVTLIKYDNQADQIVRINGNKLELQDLCFDCYIHQYQRN